MKKSSLSKLAGAALLAGSYSMATQPAEAAAAPQVARDDIDKVVECILGAPDDSSPRRSAKLFAGIHQDKQLVQFYRGGREQDKRILAGVSKNYPNDTIFSGSLEVAEIPESGSAVVESPELFLRVCAEGRGKEEVCTTFYDGGFRIPMYEGRLNLGWGVMDPEIDSRFELLLKQSRKELDGTVDFVIDDSSRTPGYRLGAPSISQLHMEEDAEHKMAKQMQPQYAEAIADVIAACRSYQLIPQE